MLKWLWCLVRVDAFQIAVARLCHSALLWGSQQLSFRRDLSESNILNNSSVFELRVLAKPIFFFFFKEGRDPSDTIRELTTITDWQLTRHTLWRRGMTMQEMALSVSAPAPRNNTDQFGAPLYVMPAEPIKCAGNFRATKQRQMEHKE